MVKIDNIDLGEFPLLLAPMEDVSDPPFRVLCKELGADLMYSEFISSEGLIRDAVKSREKLDIYPGERPIGIQIFGANLESMKRSAEIVEEANPELLDINFGCPVKKVVGKGAGAGILKNVPLMEDLTAEVVKATKLPVTVKTRLGWDESSKEIVSVTERLQDVGIKAISIHGRTRQQMYKGSADWSLIADVKNNPRIHIPVFGNGDIDTPQKAVEYYEKYGVDGIMIGRAAIGNPWIFNEIKHYRKTGELLAPPTITERVRVTKKHLELSLDWKGEHRGIVEMRRHYSNYFKGIHHFKAFRQILVTSLDTNELFDTLDLVVSKFEAGDLRNSD